MDYVINCTHFISQISTNSLLGWLDPMLIRLLHIRVVKWSLNSFKLHSMPDFSCQTILISRIQTYNLVVWIQSDFCARNFYLISINKRSHSSIDWRSLGLGLGSLRITSKTKQPTLKNYFGLNLNNEA